MIITYLGPQGTFSELAAKKYVNSSAEMQLKAMATIYDAISAVQDDAADQCIVPIENSVEGSISTTLDVLAQTRSKLFIVREIDLYIEQQLIALPGVQAKDVQVIFSHPQPLAQCQEYLRKHYPKVKTYPTNSTADAVLRIKTDKLLTHAAIGSILLAEREGMKIIAKNIHDRRDNVTRFVVLSRQPSYPKGQQIKTSFVFGCKKDRPGSLYEILGALAQDKINMTKIESRPNKSVLGEYIFFIDCEGAATDPKLADALAKIKKQSSYYKFLGSYQRSSYA